jgi:hypothetical protein
MFLYMCIPPQQNKFDHLGFGSTLHSASYLLQEGWVDHHHWFKLLV